MTSEQNAPYLNIATLFETVDDQILLIICVVGLQHFCNLFREFCFVELQLVLGSNCIASSSRCPRIIITVAIVQIASRRMPDLSNKTTTSSFNMTRRLECKMSRWRKKNHSLLASRITHRRIARIRTAWLTHFQNVNDYTNLQTNSKWQMQPRRE